MKVAPPLVLSVSMAFCIIVLWVVVILLSLEDELPPGMLLIAIGLSITCIGLLINSIEDI